MDFKSSIVEQEDITLNTDEVDTTGDLEIPPVSSKDEVSDLKALPPVGNSDELFKKLLEFQAQLRVFHWQTLSFSEHSGAGTTYDSVDDIMDKLVESYQGYMKGERIKFGGQINIINYDEINTEEWLSGIIDVIEKLRESAENEFKGSSDLLNIMDELLGSVSKFKYLLSLK